MTHTKLLTVDYDLKDSYIRLRHVQQEAQQMMR